MSALLPRIPVECDIKPLPCLACREKPFDCSICGDWLCGCRGERWRKHRDAGCFRKAVEAYWLESERVKAVMRQEATPYMHSLGVWFPGEAANADGN